MTALAEGRGGGGESQLQPHQKFGLLFYCSMIPSPPPQKKIKQENSKVISQ
jgi:hypothetical protein